MIKAFDKIMFSMFYPRYGTLKVTRNSRISREIAAKIENIVCGETRAWGLPIHEKQNLPKIQTTNCQYTN